MADRIAKALSPGNGMAAYLQIHKSNLVNADGLDGDFLNIKFAELSDVAYETNRKVSAFWNNGDRNAKGINKGVRLSSGKIMVQVIEEDFISKITKEIKTSSSGTKNKIKNAYSFNGERPIKTQVSSEKGESAIKYADQLPLCDLIIVAKGDYVKPDGTGNTQFSPNEVVQLKLKGVKMMNDIFSIAVGSAIQNKVIDILILKGVEDWKII